MAGDPPGALHAAAARGPPHSITSAPESSQHVCNRLPHPQKAIKSFRSSP